ncbi:MAG: holo-ACP synthase [Candidatus Micrarchaeota archaeon]|nr:holo-ACP synthase [Candidatus Micrarchaeota archaeon]
MKDVLGLGVDMVDVQRMAGIIAGKAGKSFIKKTFTGQEIAHAKGSAEKLAAIFAAKEAAFKAFGTGWLDGKLVEVAHWRNGAPSLRLHGKMGKLAKKMKVGRVLASLSYTECCAIAAVVLSR